MGNADLGPLFGPGYFDPQSGECEEPADAPAPQAAASPQQPGAGAAPQDPLARPRSLEDVLRAQGWISSEQWEQAVRIQGRVLIEMGAITEEQLARALALHGLEREPRDGAPEARMQLFGGGMALGALERTKHRHPLGRNASARSQKRRHGATRCESSHAKSPAFYQYQIFTTPREALQRKAWTSRLRAGH